MVKNILGMVAGGYTVSRIVGTYPELAAHDVTAALEYASQAIDEEKVIPACPPPGHSLRLNVPKLSLRG